MRFPGFTAKPWYFRVKLTGRSATYYRVLGDSAPHWLSSTHTIPPTASTSGGAAATFESEEVECSPLEPVEAIQKFHRQRDLVPYTPILALPMGALAYTVLLALNAPAVVLFLMGLAGILLTVILYLCVRTWSGDTTAVLIEYTFDDEARELFDRMQKGLRRLGASARIWHIPKEFREGPTNELLKAKRYLRRYQIRPALSTPRRVRSNVKAPVVYSEHRHLYFFPDRVYVFDDAGARAIPYGHLAVDAEQNLCVEDEDVPVDAQVVDTTWKHILLDGSPDTRYSKNPRLPVALYGEIKISCPGLLDEMFQCSQPGSGIQFISAIELMAWAETDTTDTIDDDEASADGSETETVSDDELYDEALRTVVKLGIASLSQLAEVFRIPPARAALLIAAMERDGYITATNGASGRAVNRSAVRYVELVFGDQAKASGSSTRTQSTGWSGARSRSTGVSRGRVRDPFKVLDVPEAATTDEIASAYHRLAQLYHPDKVANLAPEFQELAERRMKDLNEAYRTLTRPANGRPV